MEPGNLLQTSECEIIARRVLNKPDVRVTRFNIRPYKEEMAGFLGRHYKILLEVEGHPDALQLFAKAMPENGSPHETMVQEMRCFEKEIEFYEDVVPELTSLIGNTSWGPDFYFSKPGFLVLEDMYLKGFTTVEARKGLDLQHVTAALNVLAKLHADSLEVERRRGCTLDKIFPDVCEENLGFKTLEGMFGGFFRAFKKGSLALCELLPKYGKGSPHHEAIKALIPATCDRLVKLVQPSDVYRNVLCHSDVWVNNFQFRHDAQGRPVEARLVDFQLVRYVPPAHDIAMLFHLVCSREMLRDNQEHLLRHYYCQLAEEMKLRGLVPEEELTWNEFLESFKEQTLAGMVVACFNHQITMMPSRSAKGIFSGEDPERLYRFWSEDRDEEERIFFYTDGDFRRWVTQDLEVLIEQFILPQICKEPTIGSKETCQTPVTDFLRPVLVDGK